MFCAEGFKQVVTKPTCDSGTLIDYVYVSNSLQVDSDVSVITVIMIMFSVHSIYNLLYFTKNNMILLLLYTPSICLIFQFFFLCHVQNYHLYI